tara:strand:+ start:1270 stop:1896 length:627 start_codon:yes stop_codon:yes gene_type:complete
MCRSEKVFVMRVFLSVLILIFSLQFWAKADDIRDFEIEGMSIGDSLLNYFNKEHIKKRISITKSNYDSDKYVRAYFNLNNSKNYDVANIHFTNDTKYKIESLSGAIMNDFTFENCSKKQIQIFEDLKELFANGIVEGDPKKKIIFKRDNTKKSVYSSVKYKIEGGYIDVRCTIFSKEFQKIYPSVGSSLQVIAHSEEFIDWLRNEAYK